MRDHLLAMPALLRRAEVLRIVQADGTSSIMRLARALDVSDETIRRTIKPLIAEGLLVKVHGGVMVPCCLEESPFERRMREHRSEKEIVARQVSAIVQDGDSLILDSGTTCMHIAQALRARSRLTVVTNSVGIAGLLAQHNENRVFIAGGELCADDGAATGECVLDYLRQFHVRHGIVSVTAVQDSGRFMDAQPWDVAFSRAAFAQAEQRIVVAVSPKFGHRALVHAMSPGDIDLLVTDSPLAPRIARIFATAGVAVRYPDGGPESDNQNNTARAQEGSAGLPRSSHHAA